MNQKISRNLKIYRMYTEETKPITEIAKHYGLTRQRVYAIIKSIQMKKI